MQIHIEGLRRHLLYPSPAVEEAPCLIEEGGVAVIGADLRRGMRRRSVRWGRNYSEQKFGKKGEISIILTCRSSFAPIIV